MARLEAVQLYRPTVTLWNRLEGRPRTVNFDRAMKAEVHDALWMLSKQWQMGEFIGDDAGSPVIAKTHLHTTRLTKYQAGEEPAEPLQRQIPLEATVENRPIAFERAGQAISLDIRLLMGRQWLKLVQPVDPNLKADYIDRFGIDPPDPTQETDAAICAHPRVWQQFAAVATRSMDGYTLYAHLKLDAGNSAHEGIGSADTPQKRDELDALAEKWVAWFENLFLQPLEADNPSWRPAYLEHQFACAAPTGDGDGGEKVLTAEEYYHGHLDWYNLDIDQSRNTLDGEGLPPEDVQGTITRTFVPSSVTFGGMPHPRWWQFEDWNTNLSFVTPDTTDLNKLLLLDFMLVYSNDWFIVPVTLPDGTLTNVRGLTVTNVFGEKTWVQAAGSGSDEDWQRWNMYSLAIKGTEDVPADLTSVMLPVARKVQEGKPLEEVFLLRDEIANMVWGVETRVPLPTGRSQLGKETAYEFRNKLQQLVLAANPPDDGGLIETQAAIRYQIVNSVPENWIPFVPVHIDGSNREVQLQRASLPRILENDPDVPKKVEARTSLLREGLDDASPQRFSLHEEEVTCAGVKVNASYQRTRWHDGRVITWIGIRKQTGRGGGASGLAFDQVLPVRRAPEEG
jgi:hypothetical protein